MGLLDVFRKSPVDFNEYVTSLSPEQRKEMMDDFARHGDPEQILTDMLNTRPCYLESDRDVRIHNGFLLEYHKSNNVKRRKVYLFKLDMFSYCYYSRGGSCSGYHSVGLMRKDGVAIKIMVKKKREAEALAMFRYLQPILNGFDAVPVKSVTENDTLVQLMNKYFGDAQNVIWCEQHHDTDGDANDPYWLKLYSLSGKTVNEIFSTEEEAFITAVKLKQRIPHLLYGPSEEYKQIYKKDPKQLMALAKSKL